jgi:alpha-tubulin suppressor-like RCC1 family protein
MSAVQPQLYHWGIVFDPSTQKRSSVPTPVTCPFATPCKPGTTIEQVACGTNFTVVRLSDGTVYVQGDETKNGRLGLGQVSLAAKFTAITGLPGRCVSISSGPATTALLLDNGDVYGFGKGFGATPTYLPLKEAAKLVACAENRLLVATVSDKVLEIAFNQSGIVGDPKRVTMPNCSGNVVCLNAGANLYGAVFSSGDVVLWGQMPKKRWTTADFAAAGLEEGNQDQIVEVSCSRGQFHTHALARSSSGRIFALGSNYKAKLGIPDAGESVNSWTLIPSSKDVPFKQVIAGGIHSAAVGVDGRMHTWGCGSDGRLGHPEVAGHRYLYKEVGPRPVEAIPGSVLVAASSYYHMAAVVQ